MTPSKSIFHSTALSCVPGAANLPLVAAVSTKRLTKAERARRESLGEKNKSKAVTVFSENPTFYNAAFHKAVGLMRYMNGSSSNVRKHLYCDLYTPNAKNRFFETHPEGERFVPFH
jgi:hypothetical protein